MTFKLLLSERKLTSTLTIGFFVLFLFAALIDLSTFSEIIAQLSSKASATFGQFWQWLMLGNLILALVIAFSKAGSLRLGSLPHANISGFRWLSMIMCTLLAGGGVFWSAAEPIFHFISRPPAFKGTSDTEFAVVQQALEQSFLHWGFLAWAILGTLATIVLMHSTPHSLFNYIAIECLEKRGLTIGLVSRR
ncbi:BCCT family transporter [Enterovibrio nigricans]|uniref:BCCT, betaine/carnitine/choline family transporter n=1 Tax=Enterovibrio nigricans DSM 22720 TaxID=1121868 RepID=A0A1T4VQV6_9GAMM|nr:BCCT family transporter [Enterovibrio nigricans]PKF48888.1 hypothetical protein AT251_22865 [Enterovibrio nigricans]SKA66871.1 BCCT, betaine/carnitine/choline family transporter [Enterovibrio nigricans DSM 22720]